jgi:hypothetical protein
MVPVDTNAPQQRVVPPDETRGLQVLLHYIRCLGNVHGKHLIVSSKRYLSRTRQRKRGAKLGNGAHDPYETLIDASRLAEARLEKVVDASLCLWRRRRTDEALCVSIRTRMC